MLMKESFFCINEINMALCVHIDTKINNGLILVKVLGKIPFYECFFFRNQKNTSAAVNF